MLNEIRLVEIEIHSMCNRTCQWCPNTKFKRDKLIKMPFNMYIKILKELKNNNFNGVITYSRYNEPMLDIELLKTRVAQAKKILPDIKLVSNTNGDYLTKTNLEDLYIDELSIMDYDCTGKEKCIEKLKSIGAEIKYIKDQYIYAQFKKMSIVYCVDWPKYINLEDRGGFFNSKPIYYKDLKANKTIQMTWKNNKDKRITPCLEPTYFIGIDYTGAVTPCCHIRSDNPAHSNYILGNLQYESLAKIFNSQKSLLIRKYLKEGIVEQYPSACKRCQKGAGRYTRNEPKINYEEN